MEIDLAIGRKPVKVGSPTQVQRELEILPMTTDQERALDVLDAILMEGPADG